MSRRGRVDDAVRLEGSGGADPGVVGVVDVWSPGGELPDAQLGRNFLFFFFFVRKKGKGHRSMELTLAFSETPLQT